MILKAHEWGAGGRTRRRTVNTLVKTESDSGVLRRANQNKTRKNVMLYERLGGVYAIAAVVVP
jgi:hypothetical protein